MSTVLCVNLLVEQSEWQFFKLNCVSFSVFAGLFLPAIKKVCPFLETVTY